MPQPVLRFDVRVVEGVPIDVPLFDRFSGLDFDVHRVGAHPHAPQVRPLPHLLLGDLCARGTASASSAVAMYRQWIFESSR